MLSAAATENKCSNDTLVRKPNCSEMHQSYGDKQSINYLVFYLTDCSGSTYNLILPQLYVKGFSGDILHQITNALSLNLNRLIGPAVQFVKSWV